MTNLPFPPPFPWLFALHGLPCHPTFLLPMQHWTCACLPLTPPFPTTVPFYSAPVLGDSCTYPHLPAFHSHCALEGTPALPISCACTCPSSHPLLPLTLPHLPVVFTILHIWLDVICCGHLPCIVCQTKTWHEHEKVIVWFSRQVRWMVRLT